MDVIIIKELGKQDFIVQCGFCRGKGRAPTRTSDWKVTLYHDTKTCSVCNGKGMIRVTVTDVLISDARCQGTGLQNPSDRDPIDKCPTCGGIGARSLSGELKYYK